MEELSIYTVCTGNYKYGLFALLNSIAKCNFKGKIYVATNKEIEELNHLENVYQKIIHTNHIFGCLKAKIILDNPSDKFIYLDPDIVILNTNFFKIINNSLEKHQKLIVSNEGILPSSDIRRRIWNDKAKINSNPKSNYYYSGGFVAGLFSKHKTNLKEWDTYINDFIEPGKYFKCCYEFPLADQDILNLVLQNMETDEILSFGFPDWIGTATSINPFHEYGFFEKPLFVHATGGSKSWQYEKLPLRYPNAYDKGFYKNIIENTLGIEIDLKLSRIKKLWFTESRILPFYNKGRKMLLNFK
ncbi:MAG: hypothetical protein KDE33_15495 [Bacteroidetes bacterium]|nr:hypothetical protein [Bacteroidota bacterium]MCB9225870.1 hypothetical protein [Chitinophagales bacterium]